MKKYIGFIKENIEIDVENKFIEFSHLDDLNIKFDLLTNECVQTY